MLFRSYTYANVVISGGGGSNANARAVFSPYYGHGSSPADELNAFYAMVNTRLNYAEGKGDFPTQNDYRRIGIVANPISNLSLSVATEETLSSTYTLTLSNIVGTFALDEFITGSTSNTKALVLYANTISNVTTLRYVQPNKLLSMGTLFKVGETVMGNSSLATAVVSNIYYPNVQHNTGKVLYVENRLRITRTFDQAENIHTVIEF